MSAGSWPAMRRSGAWGSRFQSSGTASRQKSVTFMTGSPSVMTTKRSSSPKPIRLGVAPEPCPQPLR